MFAVYGLDVCFVDGIGQVSLRGCNGAHAQQRPVGAVNPDFNPGLSILVPGFADEMLDVGQVEVVVFLVGTVVVSYACQIFYRSVVWRTAHGGPQIARHQAGA